MKIVDNVIQKLTNRFVSKMQRIILTNELQLGIAYAQEVDRLLEKKEYQDVLRLERYGYKVFSQNEEDGIIQEIFRRIGVTNKKFVEFGVGNGLENNTYYLLAQGWSGLWIDGGKECCKQIRRYFAAPLAQQQLQLVEAFIYKDNIDTLIQSANISGEIDLLSVDIDGNDYHVYDAIKSIQPRVLVMEYNAKLPASFSWVMSYNPNHVWDKSCKYGASLSALTELCEGKGYQLVGTNLTGCNAFFVRKDLAANLFYTPATPEALYNPARFYLSYKSSMQHGHPSSNSIFG